jgi:transcription factor IIIB 90 kDa subunit
LIFNRSNKDYLEQQERKEKDRMGLEAAEKGRDEDMEAQAEGHARYTMKRGRKNKKRDIGDLTTEEALLAEVKNRKISRKINYDAMSSIFDDSGTFATESSTQVSTEGGMEFGEL